MFGLKKQFIKNYIQLKVVENTKGLLVIGSPRLNKVDERYKPFAQYVEKYIMMIGGIYRMDVDYLKGIVTIQYDEEILPAKQLIAWIQVVYEVLLDHIEEIEASWQSSPALLDQKLTEILEQSLSKFR